MERNIQDQKYTTPKLQRKSQIYKQPGVHMYKHFQITIMTEDIFQECLEVFIKGYIESNPFFNNIGTTREDLILTYAEKFRKNYEERPLQQIVALDTKKNNKVAGMYLNWSSFMTKEDHVQYQARLKDKRAKSKICDFKYEVEGKIALDHLLQKYQDEVFATGNSQLYQTGASSILQEYRDAKLFNILLAYSTYVTGQLRIKGMVDICYNVITANAALNLAGSKLINEINIKDIEYNGKKPFNDPLATAQLLYSNIYSGKPFVKVMNMHSKYFDWYKQSLGYIQGQNNRTNNYHYMNLDQPPQDVALMKPSL